MSVINEFDQMMKKYIGKDLEIEEFSISKRNQVRVQNYVGRLSNVYCNHKHIRLEADNGKGYGDFSLLGPKSGVITIFAVGTNGKRKAIFNNEALYEDIMYGYDYEEELRNLAGDQYVDDIVGRFYKIEKDGHGIEKRTVVSDLIDDECTDLSLSPEQSKKLERSLRENIPYEIDLGNGKKINARMNANYSQMVNNGIYIALNSEIVVDIRCKENPIKGRRISVSYNGRHVFIETDFQESREEVLSYVIGALSKVSPNVAKNLVNLLNKGDIKSIEDDRTIGGKVFYSYTFEDEQVVASEKQCTILNLK